MKHDKYQHNLDNTLNGESENGVENGGRSSKGLINMQLPVNGGPDGAGFLPETKTWKK